MQFPFLKLSGIRNARRNFKLAISVPQILQKAARVVGAICILFYPESARVIFTPLARVFGSIFPNEDAYSMPFPAFELAYVTLSPLVVRWPVAQVGAGRVFVRPRLYCHSWQPLVSIGQTICHGLLA
jgi:hypothetical protein